jgi:glycyl-tRNA synthetase alpha chain
VWLDGTEITQFTYFQQMGGIECKPVAAEITYGTERLAMLLQNVDRIWDLVWTRTPDGRPLTYGECERDTEIQNCVFNFEQADTEYLFRLFDMHEKEAHRIVEAGLCYPAFDLMCKCSHTFNLLDARGVISVTERAAYINRCRTLARKCCQTFLKEREATGYPLLSSREHTADGADRRIADARRRIISAVSPCRHTLCGMFSQVRVSGDDDDASGHVDRERANVAQDVPVATGACFCRFPSAA